MKRILLVAVTLLLAASLAQAQGGSLTDITTLSVVVGPEAAIVVNNSTTTLTNPGGIFADYVGTTSLTYFIRTSSGGTGSIVLQVTRDFPGNGPKVGTPPTGTSLKYTCTGVANGTPCSGSITALTGGTTNVATFAGSARSAITGDPAGVVWALTNDPGYPVGTYTADVTFTIAAA